MITAMLVFLAVLAVKNSWALHQSGLLGSCVVYASMVDGGQQEKCTAGVLDGLPDLSGKGCTADPPGGSIQFWTCPAPINSAPVGV